MRHRAAGAIALALLAGGCVSGGAQDDPGERPRPRRGETTIDVFDPPGATSRVELDEFEFEWDDIDRTDQGRRDAYQVAQWVTERRNATEQCLNHEPPARMQAIGLLEEILTRVPDSSQDRYQLTQCLFSNAAYWFRVADYFAWVIAWLRSERRLPVVVDGRPLQEGILSDADVEAWVTKYQPGLDKANKRLREAAIRALRELNRYRQQRPDDKSILGVVWRLYFYLQQYEQALVWLEYLLREFDHNEVPAEEPLRKEYEFMREQLQNYLAQLRIEGLAPGSRSISPGEIMRGEDWRQTRPALSDELDPGR